MDGAGIVDKAMWVCMGLPEFPHPQPRNCLKLGFEGMTINWKFTVMSILQLLKNMVGKKNYVRSLSKPIDKMLQAFIIILLLLLLLHHPRCPVCFRDPK